MPSEVIILSVFLSAIWCVHFIYGLKLFSKRKTAVIGLTTGKLYVNIRLSSWGVFKLALIFATVRFFLFDISERRLDAMIKKEIRISLEDERV